MGEPGEKTLVRGEPEVPRFGKYEVLGRIGTGGMAEIYKCRLSGIGGFDKAVVVKRMLPDLLRDKELVRMFLDEARIAAGLSHPNIVQIYEIDQVNGNPYIAMEYVRGPTLAKVIHESWRQGKPLERIAVKVLSEVASALAHVHDARDAQGQPMRIVHRDVTPHNVIVSTEGVAKLLDFGVAKASGRLSKTNVGSIKGKFRYMAPEQLTSADEIDGRTDVFAVGACLYLAATGIHAYPGRSDFDVLKAATSGRYLPPSKVKPNIDPRLERMILWAMAPALAERCPSAMALHEALDAYVSEGSGRITSHHVARFLGNLFGDLSNSDAIGGAYVDEVMHSRDFALSTSARELVRDANFLAESVARAEPVEIELGDMEVVTPEGAAPMAQAPLAAAEAAPEAAPPRSRGVVVAVAVAALVALAIVALLVKPRVRRTAASVAAESPPSERWVAEAHPPTPLPAPGPTGPAHEKANPVQAPSEAIEAPGTATVAAPQKGRLTVVTDAPARVLVDGEALGPSPLRSRALMAERHQIEVQAQGFPSQRQSVLIAPDKEVQLAFTFWRRRPNPPVARSAPAAAKDSGVRGDALLETQPAQAQEQAPEQPRDQTRQPEPEREVVKGVAVTPEPVRVAQAPVPVVELRPSAPAASALQNPARTHVKAIAGALDGSLVSCPEGASSTGAAPPAGTALWCQLPSGTKHGKYIRWFPSGVRAQSGEFLNGKKNGRWVEYYEDGSEREKIQWRHGVKTW